MPILQFDMNGQHYEYCQSLAILRFAGALAGLYPTDSVERLIVDEALNVMQDIFGGAPGSSDPEEKKRLRLEYAAGKMKARCDILELRAKDGFFVGDQMTVADLQLSCLLVEFVKSGQFDFVPTDYFDQFPKLSALSARVQEDPRVKAYYAPAQ